jgi:hypothetical protein
MRVGRWTLEITLIQQNHLHDRKMGLSVLLYIGIRKPCVSINEDAVVLKTEEIHTLKSNCNYLLDDHG